MTGTAVPELLGAAAGVPALGDVRCRPTGRCIREQLPDRVFPTEDAKFDAVVEEVQRDARRRAGRC